MDLPLTDAERCPLKTERGAHTLQWMHEHEHAPRFNHHCGDRLSSDGLARIQAYEAALLARPVSWQQGEIPDWLREFAASCLRDVPFYRRHSRDLTADAFFALPTTTRADLGREPWSFVPDGQPLDDLIVYNTSGTTGHPLDVLCHPETSSKYLPLLRLALAAHGLTLEGATPENPHRISVILVCAQQRTYTYATLSAFLGEAGFIKLNLTPSDWRDPADRVRFLDECNAEIYTGDPISFLELARLPLQSRPKALVSTAMAMLPAWREQLENHFGCPVLDFYSLNEAGPVAVSDGNGHAILPNDIYVEILRLDGTGCEPGERGEITLSGGRNPFLPLLRYRTGDFASLEFRPDAPPLLVGLEGRPPVLFRSTSGAIINNIDVSNALRRFPIAQFTLHQKADESLHLQLYGNGVSTDDIRQSLLQLFGSDQLIEIDALSDALGQDGKLIQYRSDLE